MIGSPNQSLSISGLTLAVENRELFHRHCYGKGISYPKTRTNMDLVSDFAKELMSDRNLPIYFEEFKEVFFKEHNFMYSQYNKTCKLISKIMTFEGQIKTVAKKLKSERS